jgi:hypothetical protein
MWASIRSSVWWWIGRIARSPFEPDRLFTIVGQIDAERRRNWVEQLTAARAHIARILGDEDLADKFVEAFLSFQDRPDTSSYTLCFSFAGLYPS